jgi:hypothetical protein
MTEEAASTKVLGLTFETLGIGVAKVWGLPESIQHCMRRPGGQAPGRLPKEGPERVRWTSIAANEIADTLLRVEPKDADAQLALVAKRHAPALGINVQAVLGATVKAREKLIEQALAMDLKILPGSRAAKLLLAPGAEQADENSSEDLGTDSLLPHELHATEPMIEPQGQAAPHDDRHITDMLAAGIQDITNAMVEEFKLSDVLRMVLETMYRAMGFQRVIFCMRDVKSDCLTGRFGLGQDVEKLVASFKVPLKPSGAADPDLFSAVCLKGVDTMIRDAKEPSLAQRLPAWYRQTLNAPTFLLLPLHIKAAPFGLIYADKSVPGGMVLDEKELALLRTLRNQAIMAFKQSA